VEEVFDCIAVPPFHITYGALGRSQYTVAAGVDKQDDASDRDLATIALDVVGRLRAAIPCSAYELPRNYAAKSRHGRRTRTILQSSPKPSAARSSRRSPRSRSADILSPESLLKSLSGDLFQARCDGRENEIKRNCVPHGRATGIHMMGDDLERADERVVEGRATIAKQRDLIAKLERDGHDTRFARLLLETMKTTLIEIERHRTLMSNSRGD
jgi:hypothetical protein